MRVSPQVNDPIPTNFVRNSYEIKSLNFDFRAIKRNILCVLTKYYTLHLKD